MAFHSYCGLFLLQRKETDEKNNVRYLEPPPALKPPPKPAPKPEPEEEVVPEIEFDRDLTPEELEELEELLKDEPQSYVPAQFQPPSLGRALVQVGKLIFSPLRTLAEIGR